ncbi:MAG: hypothetical protein JO367_12615 [Actinobacteria bacterium]|nr:hypothetical protein [Actinomycetota bacterium]MBV9255830.1 hypothetical protein [Actinomycetota bacterium]MBV9935139.1 hypothetical protein [Actinomycetota bacterium]
MFGDRQRPERVRSEQDRHLTRYLKRQVSPYSTHYRPLIQQASAAGGKGRELLARIPVTTLGDVDLPENLVLRPTDESIQIGGDPALALRVIWARLTGRVHHINRTHVEPSYKPVHWVLDDGIPVGSSVADLDRLAELGRRWLESAGIGPTDILVGLVAPGPHLTYWQLVLGARRAGLSALHLDGIPAPADLERLRPTVIAGASADLLDLFEEAAREGRDLSSVHTLLVVGELVTDETRARLAGWLDRADGAVLTAWAPPGVRALWTECRGAIGLHTTPAAEVVETVDGEVVWSALGWSGTVLLRLRTGVEGVFDDSRCPACGRSGVRILPTTGPRTLVPILDRVVGTGRWQVEMRTVAGIDELIVYVAHDARNDAAPVLQALVGELPPVTQFVLVPAKRIDARLAEYGGENVLDGRVALTV